MAEPLKVTMASGTQVSIYAEDVLSYHAYLNCTKINLLDLYYTHDTCTYNKLKLIQCGCYYTSGPVILTLCLTASVGVTIENITQIYHHTKFERNALLKKVV